MPFFQSPQTPNLSQPARFKIPATGRPPTHSSTGFIMGKNDKLGGYWEINQQHGDNSQQKQDKSEKRSPYNPSL